MTDLVRFHVTRPNIDIRGLSLDLESLAVVQLLRLTSQCRKVLLGNPYLVVIILLLSFSSIEYNRVIIAASCLRLLSGLQPSERSKQPR